LQGESGTGKELVARAIHSNGSRNGKPFIPINLAAVSPLLVESALFGHRKGAFTDAKETRLGCFETARGGTVFLDEIGELTQEVQVKLLRVLQEKAIVRVGEVVEIPVDVRIVSATNKNLRAEVEAGRFRKDLFYRLAVMTIDLPPLRSRDEDISLLAAYLLEKNKTELGKPIKRITPDALEQLRRYSWPGNVRELDNVIQRAIILATGDTITPELLLLESGRSPAGSLPDMSDLSLKDAQLRFEKKYFSDLLHRAGGNKTRAATLADINRTALYNHLEKVGPLDTK
jgi:transcriptional regulator with PAS, ATPase and Fis domain